MRLCPPRHFLFLIRRVEFHLHTLDSNVSLPHHPSTGGPLGGAGHPAPHRRAPQHGRRLGAGQRRLGPTLALRRHLGLGRGLAVLAALHPRNAVRPRVKPRAQGWSQVGFWREGCRPWPAQWREDGRLAIRKIRRLHCVSDPLKPSAPVPPVSRRSQPQSPSLSSSFPKGPAGAWT